MKHNRSSQLGRLASAPIGYLLIGLIWFYRLCLSPFLPPTCRFLPTCSAYALEAVKIHGAFKGTRLTIKRLMKCHPIKSLGGSDGYDPVPPQSKNTSSPGS